MYPIFRSTAQPLWFAVSIPLFSQLLISPLALAADNSSTSLDEVVVTATRTAQSIDDSLASVTVLTAEDIEKQQATSLQELLQARAGFQMVNNGGQGKITSMFLRGAESDHTLLLVDGVKLNSSSTGTPPLELIPVEMIERIEIVRGSRTSLYGSEAIGGVIQVFTKKGKAGESVKPSLTLKAGNHNTQGISAGLRGGGAKGWYSFNAKRETTDGYNSCTGSSTLFAGCFTEELDSDGYENTSFSVSAGTQLTDKTKLSANFLRSDNDIEFDGAAPFAPNESESLIQTYGFNIATEFNDKADLSFSAAHSDNRNKNFQSGVFFSNFDSELDTYSLQSNIDITDDQSVSLGVDYQKDKADTTSYTAKSRSNTGIFAAYQGNIGRHSVNVGLRNDDNEQFGNQATGNIAVGRHINSGLKLMASYGTAFKAPTFNELYFPFFGNTNLQAEESNTLEVGLHGKQAWGNWSTHIYRTKVDNLIVFDTNTNLANNLDKAEIKGLEFIADTKIKNWDLSTNLTLLDTEDKSNNVNNGNELARRPDKSLRINLDRDFGKFSLGSSVIAEADRFDDTANNRRISGYATADMRAAYQLRKDLRVQAKIGNILDKSYETASFYPQDGRNYMLSISYTPE